MTLPIGFTLGDDPSAWQTWWEFHKDRYLELKHAIHASKALRGSDIAILGRGDKRDLVDALAPSRTDIDKVVVPALKRALLDPESNRDIVSSCLVALARIGGDPSVLPLMRRFLTEPDQEKRETAALALGIAGIDAAVHDLRGLALDDEHGRRLVGRDRVDYRTRAFATYGLGLLTHRSRSHGLKLSVFDALQRILAERPRQDLGVAAFQAARLLNPDSSHGAGQRLRRDAIAWLGTALDAPDGDPRVQSHALTAAATLAGRGASTEAETCKTRCLAVLSDRGATPFLHQSAQLALGIVAEPDDDTVGRAVRDYLRSGKDRQARYFAAIALGRIGGESNRAFLLAQLSSAHTQSVLKPWLAFGLAEISRQARRSDGSRDVDASAAELREQFRRVRSPMIAAGLALALGVMQEKDAGDLILERLREYRNQDEPAGYLAVALGLMGHTDARDTIRDIAEHSARRELLLTQTSIALGLLGDKGIAGHLLGELAENRPLAVQSALAQAIGFIGDRRSIDDLVAHLENRRLQDLARAFAAVALGLVCDKELAPWNSKIAVDTNYRANVETLTGSGTGILDIL